MRVDVLVMSRVSLSLSLSVCVCVCVCVCVWVRARMFVVRNHVVVLGWVPRFPTECAVFGVVDLIKGQIPVGAIVLKDGCTSRNVPQEVIALVRAKIGAIADFHRYVHSRHAALLWYVL